MRIRTSDLGDDPWGIFSLSDARDKTKNLFLYFLNMCTLKLKVLEIENHRIATFEMWPKMRENVFLI